MGIKIKKSPAKQPRHEPDKVNDVDWYQFYKHVCWFLIIICNYCKLPVVLLKFWIVHVVFKNYLAFQYLSNYLESHKMDNLRIYSTCILNNI